MNKGTSDDLARKVATAIGNWAQGHSEPSPAAGNTHQAAVSGSGAIAQGEGAQAVGKGSVGVRGNVHGDITIINAPQPDQAAEPALRKAYLHRVMERCDYLSLAGIDPAAAGPQNADKPLNLSAVYTALLTQTPRQDMDSPAWVGEEKRRSALEQLDRHARLVLQGDPGSGKSTFVNFVALCLAGEALGNASVNLKLLTAPLPDQKGHDGAEPQPWRYRTLLPVPVVLRDFAAEGLPERGQPATAGHLWGFIEKELTKAALPHLAPWLHQELLAHGGLLLLDGLDEVPEAEQRREQVKQAVEDFVGSFGDCRVLVTSRTYAYQNQDWRLRGFAEAILAPFSDGQIRRFVSRWYALTAGLGRLSQQDAAGRAELLKQAIFSRPTLHELAQRPLLLTLMASLHAWRSGDLPAKREALYADTVDLLLNRWEQRLTRRDAAGQIELIQPSLSEYLKVDRDQVRQVLEGLAFEAHRSQPALTGTADLAEDALAGRLLRLSGTANADLRKLVEYLRDRAGLLYPRGVGVYTLPHRSFQEYLAACHLTDEEYPDRIAELARGDPDRWREVALLAGAKAARGTPASLWLLVDALCFREPDDPAAGLADQWGAQITGQALVETADLARISPANQAKLPRIRKWLIRLLRSEHLPATERALAGDNLAALGDPRFDSEHGYLPAEPMMGFIEIPAGPFTLGSDPQRDKDASDDETPQHSVSLPRYYLGRWPVTVAQFAAFVKASGYQAGHPGSLSGIANHPVVWVTWHDAVAYCRWLGGQLRELAPARLAAPASLADGERRFWQGLVEGSLGVGLPSEAEWEKAARGEGGRLYPWGNKPDPNKANYRDTGVNGTTAGGCFPQGASPWGCEDMSGNVWEWTRNLYADYPYPEEGPLRRAREDPTATGLRVLRGGAFRNVARDARCTYRARLVPDSRLSFIGFRVVVSPFFSER